jgi:hypothetical protein
MSERMGIGFKAGKNNTYDAFVLIQHLVVLAQADQKDQCGNVFEAVDPFFPFAPLTTHVEELMSTRQP